MGESTSEVGLKTGAGGDLWTAFQPDLSSLNPAIVRGNRELADLPPEAQGIAILALVQHYVQDPPPANFRVIVNPLVGWIWIGALIAVAGAVMAALARARVAAPAGGGLSRQARQGAGDREPARLGPRPSLAPMLEAPARRRHRRAGRLVRDRAAARAPLARAEDPAEAELADLEARKEAKYRQIRDAEADHASGKLSDEDFKRLDRELRGEAVDILKKLDRLRPPKQD